MNVAYKTSIGALLLAGYSLASAGEVVIPSRLGKAIDDVSRSSSVAMRIDQGLAKRQHSNLRTWVARSVDLQRSAKRTNPSLKRTTYSTRTVKDIIRTPVERIQAQPLSKPGSAYLQSQSARPASGVVDKQPAVIQTAGSMPVIFREGPGYYKFQKFKEEMVRRPIDNAAATALAKRFVLENNLIAESKEDRIGKVHIEERRISEGAADGSTASDYIVQQDIILQRTYQGRPVVNSKIVIGLAPESRDIVLLKHFNWQPVEPGQARAVTPRTPGASANTAGAGIQKRLEDKIRRDGGNFRRAEVREVIPAWFQTGSELIPVVAFGIDIEHPGDKQPFRRTYLEVINLAGPDEQLYPAVRKSKPRPAKAAP